MNAPNQDGQDPLNVAAQDPLNVAYISVTATPGTNAVILPEWPNWGPDTIPDPNPENDYCGLAHFGYAIYQKVNVSVFAPFVGWIPGGSYYSGAVQTQGELGRRYSNGNEVEFSTEGASCRVSSAPDSIYGSAITQYLWKTPADLNPVFSFLDLSPLLNVDQAVVAAQSVYSYPWGPCRLFECYKGVAVITQVR